MYFAAHVLLFAASAGILGLFIGSFLNCLAYRGVRGDSALQGRSHCTHCGHTLGALDLIPLLSYLFSGGKCRYCKVGISVRYLWSELVCALYFASIVWEFGLTLNALALLVVGASLLVLTLWDLELQIIPDTCVLIIVGAALLNIAAAGAEWTTVALRSLTGGLTASVPMLILALIMDKLLKKESMGGGDIKLLFALGLFLSPATSLLLLAFASFIGIFFGMLVKANKDGAFPFGPAICLAFWVVILYGQTMLSAYLALL